MNRIPKKITIIGLGLIGGSVAKSMKRIYPNVHITAIDRDWDSLKTAYDDNVANEIYSDIDSYIKAAAGNEIIFLCTELNAGRKIIESLIPELSGKQTILTDVFSTKTEAERIFRGTGVNYIGGHPMAGSEKSGYAAASEYLLENAMYILCPSDETPQEDLDFLKNIVKVLGAIPYVMEAERHDEAMARISHLPHITASALVNTASMFHEHEILRTLAAGGFKDITRIASGDPDLWKNITLSNKLNVANAIDDLIENLNVFKETLINSDETGLFELLERARDSREKYETGRKAIMNLMYELNIDVPDKPGIIAEISAVLKENNINIKNIYIAESRENELGCMRLAFLTKEERDRAERVLGEKAK